MPIIIDVHVVRLQAWQVSCMYVCKEVRHSIVCVLLAVPMSVSYCYECRDTVPVACAVLWQLLTSSKLLALPGKQRETSLADV